MCNAKYLGLLTHEEQRRANEKKVCRSNFRDLAIDKVAQGSSGRKSDGCNQGYLSFSKAFMITSCSIIAYKKVNIMVQNG